MYEFEKKLERFNSFYLWLIIGVCAMITAAIVSAIYINVLLGILIAICACLAYLFFVSDELKRRFGIKHKRINGGLALSIVSGKEPEDEKIPELHIPARLMWLDVVTLEATEEKADLDTQVLYIPRSVRSIEKNALSPMPMLYRIVYEGSAEEWSNICHEDTLDAVEIIYKDTQEV